MAGKISVFEIGEGGSGQVVLEATLKRASSKPLDLKLVATDGAERWEGTRKSWKGIWENNCSSIWKTDFFH